jgi:hypothetical protein
LSTDGPTEEIMLKAAITVSQATELSGSRYPTANVLRDRRERNTALKRHGNGPEATRGEARKGEPRFNMDDTNVQNVRINLKYERADLKTILRYARRRDVHHGGRYDFRLPPRLNIWTHDWLTPGCKEESSVMFTLTFDWDTASLMSVVVQPGYDWAIFLDELASLETAALGSVVYGQHRAEPKT